MAIQLVKQTEKGFIYPHQPRSIPNIATLFKNPVGVMEALLPEEYKNLFYTLAHHSGVDGAQYPQRTASTFGYQTVFPFDIDQADVQRALEYAACAGKFLGIEAKDFIVINSGNGIHLLVNLQHPIRAAGFFKAMKPYYVALLDQLNREMGLRGLPGKADPSCFEPARVFRLPGTINSKPNQPDKPCLLVQHTDATFDIDLKVVSGLGDLETENVSPTEIRRNYPNPDFPELVKECRFTTWALESVTEVHEPHAFDLFSLLRAQSPSAKLEWRGNSMDPVQLAQWVFENATASKSLARQDFDNKWDQAGKYGARKCETINHNWGRCNECPHYGRINTPLALKSKKHIGSEVNGFWVINGKGTPMHPHYEDLSKVYSSERSVIVTPQENVLNFNGTHYIPTPPLLVKSWVDRKVSPTDPIREAHRTEFLYKIKATQAISLETEEQMFQKGLVGKLNCKNGVLDILNGILTPHTPELGFVNVLPYEYAEGESSEFFLDWLDVVTQSRDELMEALLDVMAYCLWPSYDDHAFVYLVGEGKNGKSTLIHVLQGIVGQENYSSTSMDQLVNNRFAPAELEGKMVNLSEESSGTEISADQLNVIKNLSSGGMMHIERKGVQGYSYQNKAKLIFSANKTPRLKEDGTAVKRRLVVIPFDHAIVMPDPKVEQQLIAEIPKILSMLVRRIQENVKKHGGVFMIYRGGEVARKAQQEFLTAGSTCVQWAREHIVSASDYPEEDYIRVDEAYAHYTAWITESGYKYADNKQKFSRMLREHVITRVADKSDLMRKDGKIFRVYRRTKWKKEGLE